jgi:hypothetical protein
MLSSILLPTAMSRTLVEAAGADCAKQIAPNAPPIPASQYLLTMSLSPSKLPFRASMPYRARQRLLSIMKGKLSTCMTFHFIAVVRNCFDEFNDNRSVDPTSASSYGRPWDNHDLY